MTVHTGSFRRLNHAVKWRELEAALLAEHPTCACGAPAREAHRRGGCLADVVEEGYEGEDVIVACADCHDTCCTTRTMTRFERGMSR